MVKRSGFGDVLPITPTASELSHRIRYIKGMGSAMRIVEVGELVPIVILVMRLSNKARVGSPV